MRRALLHNAEMQKRRSKSAFSQRVRLSLVHFTMVWSLGLSFGLQHHHSTFSKGHTRCFHEQSLVAPCCDV